MDTNSSFLMASQISNPRGKKGSSPNICKSEGKFLIGAAQIMHPLFGQTLRTWAWVCEWHGVGLGAVTPKNGGDAITETGDKGHCVPHVHMLPSTFTRSFPFLAFRFSFHSLGAN